MIKENQRHPTGGLAALFILLLSLLLCIVVFASARHGLKAVAVILGLIDLFLMRGLFIVNPNQGMVLQLFGRYVGSVKDAGFFWANPFYTRTSVSLRIRNFESAQLKVNDHDGNPIEIAAIVVWMVHDTAEAIFEVDDYADYVRVQSEAALRNLATLHPYDAHQDHQLSLRGNTAEVAEQLKGEIQSRLEKAGVQVIEARISHLAYAPEIAAAMLRRQQASAIIAARQKIVEGAVGMVEMALTQLARDKIVELDNDARAVMVSNLMVVLCSDHTAQPIVNAGSPHRTPMRAVTPPASSSPS